MTITELVAYYAALLPQQYATFPRATATIQAFVGELLMNMVVPATQGAFDLETAVGAQLDVLAGCVGTSRTVTAPYQSGPYFSMPDLSDADAHTVPGFIDANFSLDATWFFLDANSLNGITTVLSDAELRALVKYLIAVETRSYTLSEIDAIITEFFAPHVSLSDNKNMTMTWIHDTDDPGILFSVVAQLGQLPRPAGVGNIVFSAPVTTGFFGMQDSAGLLDLTFKGFGDSLDLPAEPAGYWIAAP